MKILHILISGLIFLTFQCKEKTIVENSSNEIYATQVEDDILADTIWYDVFERFTVSDDTLFKTSNVVIINKDDELFLAIDSKKYEKIDLDLIDYDGPGYSFYQYSSSKEPTSKLIIVEAQADFGTAWYCAIFIEDGKSVSEFIIKEPRSNSEIYSLDEFISACKTDDKYILMFKDSLVATYSKIPDNLFYKDGYFLLEKNYLNNDNKIVIQGSNNTNHHLLHVFYSNGGILAFYNDGTVTGCPQCDMDKANIESLQLKETFATYTSNKTGIVVKYTNGSESEMKFYVDEKLSEDWAMKDGKWL